MVRHPTFPTRNPGLAAGRLARPFVDGQRGRLYAAFLASLGFSLACGGQSRLDPGGSHEAGAGHDTGESTGGRAAGGLGSGGAAATASGGTGAASGTAGNGGVPPTGPSAGAGARATHGGGACNAYDAASIAVACSAVAQCEPTLAEYLARLRGEGTLDGYLARQGCGLVELVPVAGSAALTFDAAGELVGYFVQTVDGQPPCGEYKYVRGEQIPATCASISMCRVTRGATGPADLCSCPCPETPPPDGVAVIEPACVSPNTTLRCGSAASGLTPIGLTPPPPPIEDCHGSYTEAAGHQCVYDPSGTFVGERRPDPGSTRCPGVTEWLTEGTPPSCPVTP